MKDSLGIDPQLRAAMARNEEIVGALGPFAPGIAAVPLAGVGPNSTMVAIERGGTWYASMVFTVTDLLLTSAEREHS